MSTDCETQEHGKNNWLPQCTLDITETIVKYLNQEIPGNVCSCVLGPHLL